MTRVANGKNDSPRGAGGLIPGTRGQPAFVCSKTNTASIPILIAAPHAGRKYPADLIEQMRNPAIAALRLEDRLIDLVADAIATQTGASLIVAQAPRAMIDLNRSVEDMDWDMVAGGAPSSNPRHAAGRRSRSGLGLVPRRLPGMGEIWKRRVPATELASRIEQVHAPYHKALGHTLERLRDRWGTALLIDLHSMPPLGPKMGAQRAVDYVLGDRFGASCQASLVQNSLNFMHANHQFAAHNRPYAGGYVLDRHGAPMRGLNAIQLEVCREAYLDAELKEPGPGMQKVVETLSGLVRSLADELVSNAPGLSLAAQ